MTSENKHLPSILIVDDNDINIQLLEAILTPIEAKLITAHSGEEALQGIGNADLALALLDVRMPKMSGYELASKLHEKQKNNKTPIIFVTAHAINNEEKLKGYSHGAVDYVTKPFLAPILRSKVDIFLDLYNQKKTIIKNSKLIEESLHELSEANENLIEREKKQRQAQLFNEAILNSIPGIFYLYTLPDLKLIKWNKRHETILGYSTEEMQTCVIHDWKKTNRDNCSKELFEQLSEENQLSVEVCLKAKDGNTIPFLLTAVKFKSDDQEFLMGVGTDISERKAAERALLQNESILKRAQKIANVGSWEYDYQSQKLTLSEEAYKIFQLEKNNAEPTLDLLYSMLDTNEFELLTQSITKVKKDGKDLDLDLSITLPNGEKRILHKQAELTFDSSGKPHKWLGTVHDITKRKKIEAELSKSLEQLHQLSKHIEKARENERLNLARELHDDLGQALTAVKIDLEIIKRSSSNEEVKNKLENTKNLVGNTIKTVQRITSQLRPEIIDDLGLEAAIEWYSSEFSQRYNVEVLIDFDDSLEVTNEDALPVFRIVQESLTNIARHANANHVEISLSHKDKEIQLSISDNGVGIKPTDITSKKSFGLMSMEERAISLGGKFEISAGEKFGTIITISFPYK